MSMKGRVKRRVHEGRSGRATPYGRRVATIRVSPPTARRFLISRRAMLVHDHPDLAVVSAYSGVIIDRRVPLVSRSDHSSS